MDIIIRWRPPSKTWMDQMTCYKKVFLMGETQLYVRRKYVESYVFRQMSIRYAECGTLDMNYDEYVILFKEKNKPFIQHLNKLFYSKVVSYPLHGKEMAELMEKLVLPYELLVPTK